MRRYGVTASMTKKCEKVTVRRRKRSSSLKKGKEEVSSPEFGLSKEEAINEGRRCLGLRECESCDICGLLCPDLCITRDEISGEVRIDLDYCKGCGICATVCPKGAISMVLEEEATKSNSLQDPS